MSLATQVREHFLSQFPVEAARIVEEQPNPDAIVQQLSKAGLVSLFEHLNPAFLQQLFLTLSSQQQKELLQAVSVRTSVLILRNLSDEEKKTALASLPSSLRTEFDELLAFPERSAGRFMDPLVTRYLATQTIGEALTALRKSKRQRSRSLYIVDEYGSLAGRVDLQDMALAESNTPMSELLHKVDFSAQLTSTEEDLVELFNQSRMDSIPVVDHDNKLLGVIRYSSLLHVAEEAATAGIQRMVGASADERALSPPMFAVKRRVVWLHINLLTAFLAAAVVGLFESTIAQFTALAILLPVVAGQSGNAGSQALAVTMRGLALREISTLHWRQVLHKEVTIGLVNGVALALTCALGVYVWSGSAGLALVIAIAMFTAMIMAGISGALVPIVLQRLGQDPATASSIILTTVTDVSGFLAFLGTATLLAFML